MISKKCEQVMDS
jgi:hypothetical protein